MSDYLRAISTGDTYAQREVDRLLEQEGIRRDGNLDYTCGLFDDDERLVATGSCFGNTIRCLAVSHTRQGEGLLNQIVSHLTEVQASRGNSHLFLYTKCASARFFGDIGFTEITRVDGKLVFMENRRRGFRNFQAELEKTKTKGEHIAAIVMNANPFTLGHRHLVEYAVSRNDAVHLFVLREEAGPIPFAVRWKLVKEGVADFKNVILHESGPYIISAATFPSYFLKDEDTVIRTHAALDISVFGKIAQCLGIDRRYVAEEPNSRVTNLYNSVMKEKLPEQGVECVIIPRLSAGNHVISASTVRQAIHDGDLASVRDMLPESTYRFFAGEEGAAVTAAIRAQKDVVHY